MTLPAGAAAEFLSGVLFGHGLVAVEVFAESASDFAAAPQRRPPRDVAGTKLAQAHAVANQFRHIVDVHAGQLRAPLTGGAPFTASSLRLQRTRRGLTIDTAAQALHTHTTRISALERGLYHNRDLAERYQQHLTQITT